MRNLMLLNEQLKEVIVIENICPDINQDDDDDGDGDRQLSKIRENYSRSVIESDE